MASETLHLQAEKREGSGRAAMDALRGSAKVPAVLYGHGIEAVSIAVEATAFQKILEAAGESTIIQLDIAGDVRNVLIHDLQRDAIKHTVSHVDFYQVNMNEETTAEVELVFEGEANAEKALGGTLVKNITHVEVRCLPKDLPHHITVDISVLKTFEDIIRVSDLPVPTGVVIEHEQADVVASVVPPRTEEELDALNAEVVENVENVEVTTAKDKADGEGADAEKAAENK